MIAEPESQPIAIYEHLFQIYPDIPQYSQQHKRIQRYQLINKRFSYIYGKQPQYFIKAPGSLNLFGDPSDYSSLSFLQCSTSNDTVAVFSSNNNKQIRVNHIQKSKYPEQKIHIQEAEIKQGEEWRNLIVIALSVNQTLKIKVQTGMDVLVDTDLLDKNNLGKTSSYLYSLIFGIAAISKQTNILKKEDVLRELRKYNQKLQNLNIRQASLFSQNNKIIEFPTKQLFTFFKTHTFVLAHSCAPFSSKSIQIKQGKYGNLKRCEIKIGIQIIKSQLGIQKQINNLKELKANLGYNIEELIQCVEEYIPNQIMTAEEIESNTQKPLIQILKSISYSNNIIEHYKYFHPYNLIIFLLKQQLLIQQIKQCLSSVSDQLSKTQTIKQIFNKSRQLQIKYFQSSSNETNKLIQIAGEVEQGKCFKIVGDYGKGNVLFFVEKIRAQFLIDHLIKEYYESNQMKMMLADNADKYVYEIIPSLGVAVLDPQYEIWL